MQKLTYCTIKAYLLPVDGYHAEQQMVTNVSRKSSDYFSLASYKSI